MVVVEVVHRDSGRTVTLAADGVEQLLASLEQEQHFGPGNVRTTGDKVVVLLGPDVALAKWQAPDGTLTLTFTPKPTGGRSLPFAPIMLSPSAIVNLWQHRHDQHQSLFTSGSMVPSPGYQGLRFNEWIQQGQRRQRFEAWVANNHTDLQTPRCDAESYRQCYDACGQLAMDLIALVHHLDTTDGTTDDPLPSVSQLRTTAIRTSLRLVVDVKLRSDDKVIGSREVDYAVLYQGAGAALAADSYKLLLQIGKLLKCGAESMTPDSLSFRDKLAQCLDHGGRLQHNASGLRSNLQLPFEIGDGQHVRCGVITLSAPTGKAGQNLWLDSAAHWSTQDAPPNGISAALQDRLVAAFYAYRQIQFIDTMIATAEAQFARLQPAEDSLMVKAGTLLAVLDDEAGGDRGSGFATQYPADQSGMARKHMVQVTAVLRQHSRGPGSMAIVLAGRAEGSAPAGAGGQSVIARLAVKHSEASPVEEVLRERLALLAVDKTFKSSSPYLPAIVGFGTVADGSGVAGAQALLTTRRGEPLHQHLVWGAGLVMEPRQVLLLAAGLASACYILLAAGVHHNDIKPDNITVTYSCTAPYSSLYHLVDLGCASCPALNSAEQFHEVWGYGDRDLATLSPVRNLLFSSLEVIKYGRFGLPFVRPLSDCQSALFTLVFLAGSLQALPWAAAAAAGDEDAATTSREHAVQQAESWEGLTVLPQPVAQFGAWVLRNSARDDVTSAELRPQVQKLIDAVRRELGVELALPSLETSTPSSQTAEGSTLQTEQAYVCSGLS